MTTTHLNRVGKFERPRLGKIRRPLTPSASRKASFHVRWCFTQVEPPYPVQTPCRSHLSRWLNLHVLARCRPVNKPTRLRQRPTSGSVKLLLPPRQGRGASPCSQSLQCRSLSPTGCRRAGGEQPVGNIYSCERRSAEENRKCLFLVNTTIVAWFLHAYGDKANPLTNSN